MATLAIATHPNGSKRAFKDPVPKQLIKGRKSQLVSLADEVEFINHLNWKIIDTLIDYKDQILAKKDIVADGMIQEVIVFYEGEEVSNDYLFKLIGFLSRTDWETIHQLTNDYKSLIVDEIMKRGKNPLIVADVLARTERMKGIDWKKYFKSFGTNYLFIVYYFYSTSFGSLLMRGKDRKYLII